MWKYPSRQLLFKEPEVRFTFLNNKKKTQSLFIHQQKEPLEATIPTFFVCSHLAPFLFYLLIQPDLERNNMVYHSRYLCTTVSPCAFGWVAPVPFPLACSLSRKWKIRRIREIFWLPGRPIKEQLQQHQGPTWGGEWQQEYVFLQWWSLPCPHPHPRACPIFCATVFKSILLCCCNFFFAPFSSLEFAHWGPTHKTAALWEGGGVFDVKAKVVWRD